MPTVRYRTVRRYESLLDPTGRPHGLPRPMLRVRLVGRQVGPAFLALVDSGADRSIVPMGTAILAGIDSSQCQERTVRGVGGRATVRVCRVGREIEGRTIEIDAGFIDDPLRRAGALLGRQGVFDAFRLGFDQRAGELLIEPYP